MFAAVNIIRVPRRTGSYPAALYASCMKMASHGILSYLHLHPEGQKYGAVTFLTSVKSVHFRVKQSEKDEKTSKSNREILFIFT